MTSLLAVPPSDDTNRIPIVNLGNFLLRHTWSIQCLSEFGIPLDSSSLSSLEEEMTMSLRNQWASQGGEDCCGSWEEGSFVRLCWGKSQDDDDENDEPRRKKQKLSFLETIGRRNNDTRQSTQDKHSQDECHHLLVDVTVQEEPSAQIACCFPQHNTKDNKDNTKIQRFAFLLTRGSKRSLEAIWQCLETKTACRVAKSLFRPSIVDMTLAVTWWTSQHFSKFGKQQDDDDTKQQSTTTKPLTLVYQVPSAVAGSGLDSVSLMVPPVALLRLANDIVVNGKKHARESTTDDDSSNDETVPLVLALQDFLRDTFKIRIERFLLTSASCSVAMLGRDGRCKPTCAELLDCALREIKDMVERRRVGNDNDSSTKANDREASAVAEETAVA
ncbi:expressed unknown protein [Seminavis robusta]|uniref:Uncharacterized protein n=1 Tax=Seminavis robusta TaxID=568900 RepID=A0A9N8H687_9STRA|nr:expressed unknown protein [Seminavis robusta]|eukprot:Sro93_g048420.1 n/a (387) ;mRNA; f:39967-41127